MLDILHSISHYHWESYHSGNTLNLNSTIIAQNWIPSVFFHESTCKPLFWVNTPWYRRLFIDLPLLPTAVEHVIAIFASCLLRPPCLPESARKVVRATTVLCSEGLLGILGTLWPVESPPGWEQQWSFVSTQAGEAPGLKCKRWAELDDVTVVTIGKKSKPSPLASQATSGTSMDQSVIPCFLVDSQNFLESPTGKKQFREFLSRCILAKCETHPWWQWRTRCCEVVFVVFVWCNFYLFCWNWLTRFRSELDWIPGNRKNDMKSVFWSALKQTDNFNDLKSIEMRQMDDLISFEIKQTDVPILMFDLDQCCVSFASLLRGKSNWRKLAKISISLMQTWEAALSLQLCVTPTLPHHTTEWKCRIFCVDPGQVHNQYLREAFLSWCRYYSHPHTQAGQMSRCARFPSIRSDLLGPKIVSADRSKH